MKSKEENNNQLLDCNIDFDKLFEMDNNKQPENPSKSSSFKTNFKNVTKEESDEIIDKNFKKIKKILGDE
ncbi:hypothetical protein [Brachyspira catarrhinii]|uniref:Uncharacterized protein n=1 Tax=Brachyspira catarrhinii TaxID=2528966 RepID=A0ABY2TPB4_9SPIR|nr:hypothetical protein [Brachyspira catarrhinii]TKZ32776.1 hypothetical protein EZH24_09045 [Brachyspira catarrhinii]